MHRANTLQLGECVIPVFVSLVLLEARKKVWHTEVVFVLLGYTNKIPETGWLINNLFSTVLEIGKSKIKGTSMVTFR